MFPLSLIQSFVLFCNKLVVWLLRVNLDTLHSWVRSSKYLSALYASLF